MSRIRGAHRQLPLLGGLLLRRQVGPPKAPPQSKGCVARRPVGQVAPILTQGFSREDGLDLAATQLGPERAIS
jgi:hypothetical protein